MGGKLKNIPSKGWELIVETAKNSIDRNKSAHGKEDNSDWRHTLIVQLHSKCKEFLRDHKSTTNEKKVLHTMADIDLYIEKIHD